MLENQSRLSRQRLMLEWSDHLPAGDFPGAYETLRSSPLIDDLSDEMDLFLAAWFERDLQGALAYLSSRRKLPGDFPAYLAALSALSLRDPQAVYRIASSDGEIAAVRSRIVVDLASTDPALARDLLEHGIGRDALREVGLALLKGGIDQTVTWLQGLSDPRLQQRALSHFAADMAEASPEKTAALAPTLPEGPGRNAVFREAAERWLGLAPDAAKAWILTLSNEMKTEALCGALIAQDLTSSDEQEFTLPYRRWAFDQEFSGHDEVVMTALRRGGAASVEDFSTITEIREPGLRKAQLREYVKQILKDDRSRLKDIQSWASGHPGELDDVFLKEIAAHQDAENDDDRSEDH